MNGNIRYEFTFFPLAMENCSMVNGPIIIILFYFGVYWFMDVTCQDKQQKQQDYSRLYLENKEQERIGWFPLFYWVVYG